MVEDGDRPEDGIESGPAGPPSDVGLIPLGDEHTETIEVRPESSIHRLASGTRIGRYIIIGGISPVGLGESYAAFDPELDCKVILKLIGVEGTHDEPAQEAEALLESLSQCAGIDHPSVCKIHATGSYGDGVFVAMEFVEGINLRQWMEARDEPFPWTEVLRVFREAGRGLAAAHRQGIVHADFKPDNVFIEHHGRVCVLDFGLTRPPDPRAQHSGEALSLAALKDELKGVLSSGEVPDTVQPAPGTPFYQAPEQLLGMDPDAKTDQFAFCVAFYEALYGELPFPDEAPDTLLTHQVRHEIRPAPTGSRVPAWLREMLVRGLHPRRSDRWSSMESLLGALDRDPVARKRRWVIGSAIVAACLVATAGLGYLALREARQCEPDETRLAGIWDPAVRTELHQPFAAAPAPYAEQTWSTVQTRLDEWANEWLELRTLACQMTQVRDQASEELLAQRYACLDARLREIEAFSVLYREATPLMIERAGSTLFKIPLPRSCIAPASLKTFAPAPESLAERVGVLRQQESRAWIAWNSGATGAAREAAGAVAQELEHLDYPPLRVDNLLLRAQIDQEADPAAALNALQEATALADSHDLQQLAAQGWLALASTAPDPERAEFALEHAAFTVDQAQDERLSAALHEKRGDLAAARGHMGTALTAYREALAALDKASDPNLFAKARLLQNQGELLARRDDPNSAARYFERALELMTRLQGSEHPDLVHPLTGLGAIAQGRGQRDEAYRHFERALDLVEQRTSIDPLVVGSIELSMADLELERGRIPNAQVRVSRAVELLRSGSAPPDLLAHALKTSAKLALAQERPEIAQQAIEQARALRDGPELQELLAQTLWAHGTPESRKQAIKVAESVRSDYARAESSEDVGRVEAWLSDRVPEDDASE